jgi:peroxiredoxin
MLKIGDKAPDFTLFNSDKQEISLASFKGKNLIIHFFPLAFTATCVEQLCTVRDDISSYHNDTCDVVAISNDSLFVLDKFKQEQKLNFNLLSDYNKTVCKDYDALEETFVFNMHQVAKRAAFVVDANGVIQYAEVLKSAKELPNFAAIDAVLKSLV